VKFTLVYDGDLPATGNKSKPDEAGRIRNALHDQLADLWESHVVFRQLARTARINKSGKRILGFTGGVVDAIPSYQGPGSLIFQGGDLDNRISHMPSACGWT
jgi:hypothetical protein